MTKVKVPLGGSLFELASGRQLVPGEIEELSADEEKENKDQIKAAIESGVLLDAKDIKTDKGGD